MSASLTGNTFAEEAENLDMQCSWTFRAATLSPRGDYITDRNRESRRTLAKDKTLHVILPEEAAYFCVEWYERPATALFSLLNKDGDTLREVTAEDTYVTILPLEAGTAEVVLKATEADIIIAEAHVFSDGELPEPYRVFLPLPEKLDYMVFAAHPDDDVLFLGAVVPYLGGEAGLAGTIVYMTKPVLHQRNTEALMGAWTMGLRYTPIFGSFKDVFANSFEKLSLYVNRDELLTYVVRLLRQYKPELVFTHEPEGEYGHYEHRLLSDVVQEAFRRAAQEGYDPESVEKYGVWQVKKLYLHDYEQSDTLLLFDPDAPLSSFGGKSAYEICCEAFTKHVSQQKTSYAVHRYIEHENSFNAFGLAASVVGDFADPLEGIDPPLLSNYVPPTPTPLPTPTPTPLPTDTPAPIPTAVPYFAPPTVVPAIETVPVSAAPDTPLPDEGELFTGALPPLYIALLCLLGAVALGGCIFFIKKWRTL